MSRFWAVILLTLGAVACSPGTGTTVGVVTEVQGTLTDIESFTVLADGEETVFLVIEGQEYEFPLDHLREHLLSGEPVVVDWEIRDGERHALAITDG